jgi:hypothetical protein
VEPLLLLAIVLAVYGALVLATAIFKPEPIWKMAKVQGFVSLLGETGTVVLFVVVGIAAFVGAYFSYINADLKRFVTGLAPFVFVIAVAFLVQRALTVSDRNPTQSLRIEVDAGGLPALTDADRRGQLLHGLCGDALQA